MSSREPAIKDWGAVFMIAALFAAAFGLNYLDRAHKEPEPSFDLICLDAEGSGESAADGCTRFRAVPTGPLDSR